ncbi:MAG: GNAT family N-acetyltransferase [Candidatus Peribacteraceae bacterium]|nr:GNAT family N-acetyltransferase [Candidatus Peribacteraceae bacterium]
MTPEETPTNAPVSQSIAATPGATVEDPKGTVWPRSLNDLPADSPVRTAYIAYCNRLRHAAPQGSANRPVFRQAIQETKQACLELLRIAEGGTAPSACAEHPQPTVRWMIRRDMLAVWDIEEQTFTQPPQEPLDDKGLMRILRERNTVGYIAAMPIDSPTAEDWAAAEENYVATKQFAQASTENVTIAPAQQHHEGRATEQRDATAMEHGEETETERQERLRPYLPTHVCGHMIYELHRRAMNVLTIAVPPAERGGPHGQAMVARLLEKLMPDKRRTIRQEVEAAHLPPSPNPQNLRDDLTAIDQCRDFYLSPEEQTRLRQTLGSFPDTPLRTQLLELCGPLLADGAERFHLASQRALQSVRCLLALASDAGDTLWIDDPETRKQMKIANVPQSDRDAVRRFYEVITDHERGSHAQSDVWISATDPERDSVAGLAFYNPGPTPNHPLTIRGIWIAPNARDRGITLLLAEKLLRHLEARLAPGIQLAKRAET